MNLITVRPYSWSVSCMTIGTATAIAAKINPKRTVRSRLLQQQQQPLLPHVLMLVAEVFYNQTFGLGRMWKNGGFGRSLICSQFFWENTAKLYNLISHFFCFKYSLVFSCAVMLYCSKRKSCIGTVVLSASVTTIHEQQLC